MMSTPENLLAIVDQITRNAHTEADLLALRQMLTGAVATGERSLAISGDANGATIATGDGNTVLHFTFQADGLQVGEKSYRGDGADVLRSLLQNLLQPKVEINWQHVSRSFLGEQLRLTTNPLTAGEGISYRTEQVYVPLGLVERKRQTRRGEDVSPERGSLLYEEVEITQRFENEQFLEQVLQQGRSPKSRGKRIAIIGEPGAGKTTLLQQIARWVSENIDGAIAIWVSLADLQGQELEDYLLERWLPAVVQQVGQAEASTQVKDAFVAQVQQGRVWLLLDGVDEMQVSSGNPLSEIERQVRLGGLLSQSRIVLTCRLNLWDGNRHALDTFDTYRTLEFSYPVQVEQFVGQWFGALPEDQWMQTERLCTALKAPGKERIRDLVKNPLRLTLLCFNWYLGEGTLPETKAGLYEQVVTDFYEWKREQFPTTAEQRRRLNAALGELAREAIDKEETRFRLRHDFVSEFLGEPDEPDSLFQLALHLGWLNKVGVDAENPKKAVYAFFHPTFQEYFAALAIDDWQFLLNHIPEDPACSDASYRAFESHWKESFILWLGRSGIDNESKNSLIEALINFKDAIKPNFYWYQAYFLATLGVSEFKECKFKDSIYLQIIKWGMIHFNLHGESIEEWLHPIAKQIRIVLKEIDSKDINKKLLQLFKDNYAHPIYRQKTIWLLAELQYLESKTIDALIKHISYCEKQKNLHELLIGIEVLGKISSGRLEAIPTLIRIINNKLDNFVDENYLAWPNKELYADAISILGDIGSESSITISFLIELLYREFDKNILYRIIDSLSKARTKLRYVTKYLIVFLSQSQDLTLNIKVIEALRKIDFKDSNTISVMNSILEKTDNEEICLEIASFFIEIELKNPVILSIFSRLLTSKRWTTVERSALLLNKYNPGNRDAIDALVKLIKTDSNDFIRWSAVDALIEIDPQNPVVIPTLEELSLRSNDSINRCRAAESLWSVEPENLLAINTLFNLLQYDEFPYSMKTYACQQAIRVLGEFSIDILRSTQALIEVLLSSVDSMTRWHATKSLIKLIKVSDKNIFIDILLLLKNYLNNKTEQEDYDLYLNCYEIVWHCSRVLPYPEFYQTWQS